MDTKKVWGILLVKDEEDIAYHSVLHMAEEGLDGIYILDNMSTDNTKTELLKVQSLLEGSTCQIVIDDDLEPAYYQSRKMSSLARLVHDTYGADWIVPLDCDELWYATDGKVADVLRESSAQVVAAVLWNHFPTAFDIPSPIPFQQITWRQKEPGALPKVAARYEKGMLIEQGNHGVEFSGSHIRDYRKLSIRHFPNRSWKQFLRKVRNGAKAYQLSDLPEIMGAHWRGYGRILETSGEDVLRKEVFEKYFYFYSPADAGLILDPAPFRRWNV